MKKTHVLSVWTQRPLCGTRGNVEGAENPREATCTRCNPPGPRTVTFKYRSGREEKYLIVDRPETS